MKRKVQFNRKFQSESESEEETEDEEEDEKPKPVPQFPNHLARDHVKLFHDLVNGRLTREEFLEKARTYMPQDVEKGLTPFPNQTEWMAEASPAPGANNASAQDEEMDVDRTPAPPENPAASSTILEHTRDESSEEPAKKRLRPSPPSPPEAVEFNSNSHVNRVEYNVIRVSSRRMTIENTEESSSEGQPRKL